MGILVAVMLVCLPLLVLAVLAGQRAASHGAGWRDGVLSASTLWAAFLAIVTECLGAAHLLTRFWLYACWAALALGLEWTEPYLPDHRGSQLSSG